MLLDLFVQEVRFLIQTGGLCPADGDPIVEKALSILDQLS